ncbi:MAG: FeoB-associated Cys-rich membrane protein [Clostridia bacterium]|nr:FeoB-associated Cys-rich membrane protein [Clostridia bacterium]
MDIVIIIAAVAAVASFIGVRVWKKQTGKGGCGCGCSGCAFQKTCQENKKQDGKTPSVQGENHA